MPREISYHPAVKKDLKRLDPQIARSAFKTIESLAEGNTSGSTHPLHGPLKGWNATDIQGTQGHRITHRSIPGGDIEIGHIGPHNYDQAVQRLAAQEQTHWHVSDSRNRDSIAEHGLSLEHSSDNRHIWLHGDEEEARQYQQMGNTKDMHGNPVTKDLYRVDTTGYRTSKEPHGVADIGQRVVKQDIPPERIKRIAASSAWSICPCGTPVDHDPIDGWQHRDGSVSHDGEFYGKSVSDLMEEHQPIVHRFDRGVSSPSRVEFSHGDTSPARNVFRPSAAFTGSLPRTAAWSEKKAIQTPPEGLQFEHEDKETGGSKHPIVRQLRAIHPEHGEMGSVDYYPPKRSNGRVAIDSLYVHPDSRRKGIGSALMNEVQRMHPDSTIDHGDRTDDGNAWWSGYTNGRKVNRGRTSAFTPTKRVFTHTCGLDHRLFDADEHLYPEVRAYILGTLGRFWTPLYGPGWESWSRVYFAGSEASEWTSETLEGNNDFDVLVGVDYDKFKAANPEYKAWTWTNEMITNHFNQQFRELNNPNAYITVGSTPYGPFDNTFFCNKDSYDITRIKPYAAYNVSADRWAVKPPHLPHWSLSDLPSPVQRVLRACDRLANDVLKLQEPERTQQGAALFDAWHSDRSRAFGDNGEGWYDIANLREKWLDQEGTWAELVNCKHRFDEGLGAALPGWSNTPRGYVAARTAGLHDAAYGSNDIGKLFGDRLTTPTPFPAAGRLKSHNDYDEGLVARSITHPHEFPVQDVDPRELRSRQPSVTRDGVKHYMDPSNTNNGDNRLGNDVPRVYHREDGQKLILSGHHRAAAAFLKGEPLKAMVIKGPWGAPRAKTAVHIDDYQHDLNRTWYHGSPNKIQEFGLLRPAQSGDWNAALGHHFSSEPEVAKQFGKNVHPANLDIKNPKIYNSETDMDKEVVHHEVSQGNFYTKHLDPSFEQGLRGGPAEAWKQDRKYQNGEADPQADYWRDAHTWLHHHPDKRNITRNFKSRIEAEGHDGIVYGNEFEGPRHASAIAFHPEQIHIKQS